VSLPGGMDYASPFAHFRAAPRQSHSHVGNGINHKIAAAQTDPQPHQEALGGAQNPSFMMNEPSAKVQDISQKVRDLLLGDAESFAGDLPQSYHNMGDIHPHKLARARGLNDRGTGMEVEEADVGQAQGQAQAQAHEQAHGGNDEDVNNVATGIQVDERNVSSALKVLMESQVGKTWDILYGTSIRVCAYLHIWDMLYVCACECECSRSVKYWRR
jgi:hypothetical protein